MLTDFPKIQCPFIRKKFEVGKNAWKKHGHKLQLRSSVAYLVVDEVNPGYEWVFEDPDTFCCEKLDGTNVKLRTEKGRLIELQNRKNIIDPLQIVKGNTAIIEAIFMSVQRGYINREGIQAGEVIGPKLQGNPYKLDTHLFYPFEKAIKHLSYRSFHEHNRTFKNWELWFKDWLFSRFTTKRGNKDIMAEGIVFYNLKRRAEGKPYMAKLRRDMFPFFYSDKMEIVGYPDTPIPFESK